MLLDTNFDSRSVFQWKWKLFGGLENENSTDDEDYYCEIDDPSDDSTISRALQPLSRGFSERPPAPLPAPPLPPARKHSLSLPPEPLAQYNRSSEALLPPPLSPINPQKKPVTLPRPLAAAPETPRRDASPKPPTKDKLGRTLSESCLGPTGFGSEVKQLEIARFSRMLIGDRDTTPSPPLQPSPRPAAWISSSRRPPDGCESSKRKHSEDVLPKSALRLDLDKVAVSQLLENKLGVYILRESQNTQSKLALSVWTGDRVRHYMIFFEDKIGYALDPEGKRFEKLEELLRYYRDANLPKCDVRLIKPYK